MQNAADWQGCSQCSISSVSATKSLARFTPEILTSKVWGCGEIDQSNIDVPIRQRASGFIVCARLRFTSRAWHKWLSLFVSYIHGVIGSCTRKRASRLYVEQYASDLCCRTISEPCGLCCIHMVSKVVSVARVNVRRHHCSG
jgi:hypothetical protein